MTLPSIPERVAVGEAFLDQHDPDWWRTDDPRAINLDKLNLAFGDDCVLGQRCPLTVLTEFIGVSDISAKEDLYTFERAQGYHAYAAHLSGEFSDWAGLNEWATRHGFSAATRRHEYLELTAEWRRVITARRTRLAVSQP